MRDKRTQLVARKRFPATRVAKARALWLLQRNKTFVEIRGKLKQMCSGLQRCMYCEDSRGNDLAYPVGPHVEHCLLVLRRLGQALAQPAGHVGAQCLPGGEPDELPGVEPPAARTVPAAAASIVRRQGLPQPKLSTAVTEARLLLHQLAVDQLVASPPLRQGEEIRFGRRRIRVLRGACHRGERSTLTSVAGAVRWKPARA